MSGWPECTHTCSSTCLSGGGRRTIPCVRASPPLLQGLRARAPAHHVAHLPSSPPSRWTAKRQRLGTAVLNHNSFNRGLLNYAIRYSLQKGRPFITPDTPLRFVLCISPSLCFDCLKKCRWHNLLHLSYFRPLQRSTEVLRRRRNSSYRG